MKDVRDAPQSEYSNRNQGLFHTQRTEELMNRLRGGAKGRQQIERDERTVFRGGVVQGGNGKKGAGSVRIEAGSCKNKRLVMRLEFHRITLRWKDKRENQKAVQRQKSVCHRTDNN